MRKSKLAKVTAIVNVLTQNTHLSVLVTFLGQMELVAKCNEIKNHSIRTLHDVIAYGYSKDPKCHS